MSGKAPGFADLRAKFEGSTNSDTSPPSRGRSPAGQERVNATGSAQKIRTSFVSVERSGQMAPLVNQNRSMGSNDDSGSYKKRLEGTTELDLSQTKGDNTNGLNGSSHGTVDKVDNGIEKVNGWRKDTFESEQPTVEDSDNLDKLSTAAEQHAPNEQQKEPNEVIKESAGAPASTRESLGELLKGSEFEPEISEQSAASSPKKAILASNPSTPSKKQKSPQKTTPVQVQPVKTPTADETLKPDAGSAQAPTTVSQAQVEPTVMSSSAPATENSVESPKTPTTPKSISKKPIPKGPTSRQSLQSRDANTSVESGPKTKIAQKTSRLSTLSKPTVSAASKAAKPSSSTAAGPVKKSAPSSPTTVKPKPKSPTRPVRLPTSATAPTAASAAKLGQKGGAAAPRPSSRASTTGPTKPSTQSKLPTAKVPPKPSQTAGSASRSKLPRSSLPASSTAASKPKPRTSTASTRTGGDDFLSRMMRPTQASASKTHEKIEHKTPPKKRVSVKPEKIVDEKKTKAENGLVASEPEPEPQDTKAEGTEIGGPAIDSSHQPEDEAKEPEDGEDGLQESPKETPEAATQQPTESISD